MNPKVTIVDYGLGNLHSVANALKVLSIDFTFDEDGSKLKDATHVILPGVGAFADGMSGLQRRGQDSELHNFVASGRGPLLGICLGAQLLFEESEEFGQTNGLNIIPGKIVPVPANGEKVPHVGWKKVELCSNAHDGIDVTNGMWAYFVHSFHAIPADASHVLGVASFGSEYITAMVGRDLVFGCQFHPEKSGRQGLDTLKSFINL